MEKATKKNIFLFAIGIIVVVAGFLFIEFGINVDGVKQHDHTPILFVSDLNKTSKAANHLTVTSSREGGEYAMKINVYPDGKIYYHPNENVHAKYPIIKVNFNDNTASTVVQAKWLNEILVHLNRKYRYQQYNALGFGSGSLTVYQNAVSYGQEANHMRLTKFISIGGPFKGIMPKQNIMNHRYPKVSELRDGSKTFPKGVSVLNVYGQLSRANKSDGRVTTSSARELKKLVPGSDYQEIKVSGKAGRHSKLLSNQMASRIIERFLFAE